MSLTIIPVDAVDTYYSFETLIDGESYRFTFRWNSTSETWYADLEGLTVDLTLLGLALIVGSDLLSPFAILELGSLYLYDTESRQENPTRDSLGGRHRLIHISRGQSISDVLESL